MKYLNDDEFSLNFDVKSSQIGDNGVESAFTAHSRQRRVSTPILAMDKRVLIIKDFSIRT